MSSRPRVRVVKFQGPADPLRGRGYCRLSVDATLSADLPMDPLLQQAADSLSALYGYRVEPHQLGYKWMPEVVEA